MRTRALATEILYWWKPHYPRLQQ